MTATMACRGPVGEGIWADGPAALGHRPLAIIDLPSRQQPMTLQDGGVPAGRPTTSGSCVSAWREGTGSRRAVTPRWCCTRIRSGAAGTRGTRCVA
jgi:hypothetical protein